MMIQSPATMKNPIGQGISEERESHGVSVFSRLILRYDNTVTQMVPTTGKERSMPSHRYHGISSHPLGSTMTYSHLFLISLPNPFLSLIRHALGVNRTVSRGETSLLTCSPGSTLPFRPHLAQI